MNECSFGEVHMACLRLAVRARSAAGPRVLPVRLLLAGLVLAAELNRTLVLPRLLPDGKARRRRGNDGTVPFR